MPTEPAPSTTHLVLIPSYNPGPRVRDVVRAARRQWHPVWVVVDGSSDGSAQWLREQAVADAGLHVIVLPRNRGKGGALLAGLEQAQQQGYTHALTMDSDGQHPSELIAPFMRASMDAPQAMILGQPVFGPEAPRLRVWGRQISNAWVRLETPGAGIADSLYGFRVYPVAPLVAIMRRQRFMRRFDFDPEAVVRLAWAGVAAVNLPAPVRYFSAAERGVSHFKYWRDNALLTWMHLRLLCGFARRLPRLLWHGEHRP